MSGDFTDRTELLITGDEESFAEKGTFKAVLEMPDIDISIYELKFSVRAGNNPDLGRAQSR